MKIITKQLAKKLPSNHHLLTNKTLDNCDINAIRESFEGVEIDKPLCVILDTVKGKGVSFMEHPSWHCKVPTEEEYEIAMKELGV